MYSPHVLQRLGYIYQYAVPEEPTEVSTHIEKGAMRRTTCWEFLGPLRLGMSSGSKSGGKYLLRTEFGIRAMSFETTTTTHLYVQPW
jgi:hypothetical protein